VAAGDLDDRVDERRRQARRLGDPAREAALPFGDRRRVAVARERRRQPGAQLARLVGLVGALVPAEPREARREQADREAMQGRARRLADAQPVEALEVGRAAGPRPPGAARRDPLDQGEPARQRRLVGADERRGVGEQLQARAVGQAGQRAASASNSGAA
jgi:hypothetical protein